MNIMYECKNVGCVQTFKHRSLRSRHKKQCTFPPPEQQFEKLDEGYRCNKCSKVITHFNNIPRHRKRCVSLPKLNFPCEHCNKVFPYKSKLLAHMKVVNRKKHNCLVCSRTFKHEDHLLRHKCKPAANWNTDLPTFINSVTDRVDDGENVNTEYNSHVDDIIYEALVSYENVVVNENIQETLSIAPFVPEVLVIEEENKENDSSFTLISSPITNTSVTHGTTSVPLNELLENTNPAQPETPQRTRQFRFSKQKLRASLKIDSLLSSKSIEQRKTILSQYLDKQEDETELHGKISNHLIAYLKQLYEKKEYKTFFETINGVFPSYDEDIIKYLSSEIGVRRWLLSKKYKDSFLRRSSGRPRLAVEIRQCILNVFIENSIFTADRRNGRDKAKLNEKTYKYFYEDLTMPKEAGSFELETNKRNIKQISAVKRILTCGLDSIQKKVSNNICKSISHGIICNHRPFFITFASEREKILCMCIICLNIREVFESLMSYFKSIDVTNYTSVSKYLMQNCECDINENGYYESECCLGICNACKDTSFPSLPTSADSEKLVRYIAFESLEHEYFNIKLQKIKKTKRVERRELWQSVTFLHSCLKSSKITYTYHRYQAENDKYTWPKILATIDSNSPIFHMDYSENLQLTPKHEPQSAHFNKRQSTLHCSVMHTFENETPINKYIYHFTECNTHDTGMTFTIIKDLLTFSPEFNIMRFKSDNCSSQYKCKYIFQRYKSLSEREKKTVIVYYGVSGHGKGLVDAMGGFGVKTPLRKAIITHNKYFKDSEAIVQHLEEAMAEKSNWFYMLVNDDELSSERKSKEELLIVGCKKLHMISVLFMEKKTFVRVTIV